MFGRLFASPGCSSPDEGSSRKLFGLEQDRLVQPPHVDAPAASDDVQRLAGQRIAGVQRGRPRQQRERSRRFLLGSKRSRRARASRRRHPSDPDERAGEFAIRRVPVRRGAGRSSPRRGWAGRSGGSTRQRLPGARRRCPASESRSAPPARPRARSATARAGPAPRPGTPRPPSTVAATTAPRGSLRRAAGGDEGSPARAGASAPGRLVTASPSAVSLGLRPRARLPRSVAARPPPARGASAHASPSIANAGAPRPANSQNQSTEPWIAQ